MASCRQPLCRHRSIRICRHFTCTPLAAGCHCRRGHQAAMLRTSRGLTLVYVKASAEAAVHYFTVTRCLCYLHLLLRPCAKYCDEHVCLSVCLSVCPTGYLRNHTRDLYQFFARVAHVRGSVRLRMLTIGRIAYRGGTWEGGDVTGVRSAGEV